jgi:Cd2+/Zn2+-exporting ATPase
VNPALAASCEELAGRGVRARVKGRTVLAGNIKLMREAKVDFPEFEAPGTVLYIAVDGKPAGRVVIADELKADSAEAVRGLKRLGVKIIAMLTGDTRAAGENAARELGLDRVFTGLLPHEKVAALESLEKEKPPEGKTVFVGDGINDAPVLARSDIGIAMGALGSDAAIEAADVVLMTDEPSKLNAAVKIARKTGGIVRQNIVFALGVKGAILVMGAAGVTGIWTAVFGDVGVAFLAILNALRAMGPAGPAGRPAGRVFVRDAGRG